jgi:hypothetical protein
MNEVVWLTLALVVTGVLWLVRKRFLHAKENLGKKDKSPDDIYPLF